MDIAARLRKCISGVVADATRREADRVMLSNGAVLAQLARDRPPVNVQEAEFKVFSQQGEDGVISWLIGVVEIPHRTFVEIGVEDYRESNTRFLAAHHNWSGIIIDGGTAHLEFVSDSGMDWRYGVRSISAFVTKDNINDLIGEGGLSGDIGLLSIDVDGVDLWLLDAVEVVSPRILIIEYAAIFGPEISVTVPYDAGFFWGSAHWSMTYYGASLQALVQTAEKKGYSFLGCESHGVNAFFVRSDLLGDRLSSVSVQHGYQTSRFPIARTRDGDLDLWLNREEKLAMIADLPVVEIPSGQQTTVASALKSP